MTPRRSASQRLDPDSNYTSYSLCFWVISYAFGCLFSVLLGFRFSRAVFFLLLSPATSPPSSVYTTVVTTTLTTTTTITETLTLPTTVTPPPNLNITRPVVGRHGIRIRPWPHPNPVETTRAQRILDLVQKEQQRQYGVKAPRRVIVVTPTYVRTMQTVHLVGVMHSLMLAPYELTWVVVEAGGVTKETASIFAKSNLDVVHVPFIERKVLAEGADRRKLESRMRLHGLRIVRDRKMDGVILFADDSNIHSPELFDEIQKVKWMGAISVGILTHSASNQTRPNNTTLSLPVQGPACNASGHLSTWRTFRNKLEWSGFVMNSRMLWKESEEKPDWVRDLDDVGKNREESDSPLGLLNDASFVEPLGKCGKEVMVWWLRAEARPDSKFPPGWILDPSLEVTVLAE